MSVLNWEVINMPYSKKEKKRAWREIDILTKKLDLKICVIELEE